MRFTYAVYLELSLDKSLPGFLAEVSQRPYCDCLDLGAIRRRREIERIEFENVNPADEVRCRQFAQDAAEAIADQLFRGHVQFERCGINWRDFGRVTVELVEDAPNPTWTHGMGALTPAVLCPKCNKPMVSRQGPHGPFWGCSEYPACRGTRLISK